MGTDSKQVIVALAIAGLIVANYWFGPQRTAVTSVLYGAAGSDPITAVTFTPVASSGPASNGQHRSHGGGHQPGTSRVVEA